MTLYEELKAAGVEISNHESGLYFPVNEATKFILDKPEHRHHRQITITFLDNVTHDLWFDVPFAFEPWWWERCGNIVAGCAYCGRKTCVCDPNWLRGSA